MRLLLAAATTVTVIAAPLAATSATASTATPHGVAAPVSSTFSDSLIPAGRMSGGKDTDVLDVQQSSTNEAVARSMDVTLRHGLTGSKIWRFSVPEGAYAQTNLNLARVGSKGIPGVIVTESESYSTATAEIYVLVVDAYSGRTGKLVWGKTLSGSTTNSTGAITNIPTFAGVFHGRKGPDSEVLVSSLSGPSGATNGQAEVIGAANGAVSKFGTPYSASQYQDSLYPLPDLNGDGLDDVAVVSPGTPGDVIAETATGHHLWGAQPITLDGEGVGVSSVGKLSHTAYPDLDIYSVEGGGGPTDSAVVNGRTGKTEFVVPDGGVSPLGFAGTAKRRAVGVLSFSTGDTATAAVATASWKALSATGATIYHGQVSATAPFPSGSSGGGFSTGGGWSGNLKADGSLDTAFRISANAGSAPHAVSRTVQGYIDGRTGTFHSTPATAVADGSLHSGAADDLLEATESNGVARLTTWSGSTGKRYYARSVPAIKVAFDEVQASGMRVSGAACSDIAIAADSGPTATAGELAVLTARGQPLWMVSFGGPHRAVGTLHHYPKPKHFCE